MQHPGFPQNLPSSFRCGTHPEREGVGVCVNCRSVICVECSTKIDRMNYCIRCLAAATQPAPEAARESPARDAALGIPVLVVSFVLTVGVFALMGLLLAMLRATGGVKAG
jgi:hypothetical protein